MADRPSFDVSKLSTADKILLGGSLVLLIDSFLPWQRVCVKFLGVGGCVSASAWGGSGSFVGVLMGLLAIVLLVGEGLMIAGVAMPPALDARMVLTGVAGGTVLFGLIKFLIVVGNHGGFGAWIGLILLIVLAYGAWMKFQEAAATGPDVTGGFSAPPPPPTA